VNATRSGVSCVALFHPDYDRRLRLLTESADPSQIAKALAGSESPRYRRWGITPRPENISKIDDDRPVPQEVDDVSLFENSAFLVKALFLFAERN
jgi:hypothetical protein